jgi:sialate O-acetylesterase
MQRLFRFTIAAAVLTSFACPSTRADVRPHALFSDGAVLQQGTPVPVWGMADPGETVGLTVYRDGQPVAPAAWTAADAEGHWRLNLAPFEEAGGPYELQFTGKSNKVTVKDVLVGEVWVCGGQSNMEWPLQRSANPKEAVANSANPKIRLFKVANQPSQVPEGNARGRWAQCGPESVERFSAVGYYFGRDLQKKLGVPIGLIQNAWGGTPAEVWTSRPVLTSDPKLSYLVRSYEQRLWDYPKQQEDYEAALKQYQEEVEKAKKEKEKAEAEEAEKAKKEQEAADSKQPGKAPAEAAKPQDKAAPKTTEQKVAADNKKDDRDRPKEPKKPIDPKTAVSTSPYILYNSRVATIIPYAIRGAIWYQGESNAGPGRAEEYAYLFPTMIKTWRHDWGQGDFPFLFVQLAPFQKIEEEPTDRPWAWLREAQRQTSLTLPNAAMAVITDVGDEKDIHPKQKQPVGERLAAAALALAYHQKVPYTGPVYDSMKVVDGKAILTFKNADAGLEARGSELTGFTVAGTDGKFVRAEAMVQGNQVIVSSPSVHEPVAVRFGWDNHPVVNLWGKDGLPASPFRTDNFPSPTAPKPAR